MKRTPALLSVLALSGCLTSMPNATSSNDAASSPSSASTPSKGSASNASSKTPEKPTKKQLERVVGYFPDWTHNREGKCKFTVEDIDPMLFTHLNFAFARVDGGERAHPTFKLAPFDKSDLGPDGQYAHFVALKKKNPKLKTLLSVGGWTHSDPPYDWIFSAMAETPEGRKQFIDSAIKYLRENGFDGLDLDWEYPSEPTRGGRAMDTGNYIKLLSEVHAAFQAEKVPAGKDKLLFTVAAPSGVYIKWYDIAKMHPSLDWINLMSYDYAGAWDHRSGHNAPNPELGSGVAASVSIYKNFGVPADKLVVGMATYGHTFAGVEEAKVGAPATGPGPKQHCTEEPGLIAYFEMEELLNSGHAKAEWDDNAHVPFAYDEKSKVWFSYDDPKSFNQKLDFIEEQGLGGAMIWEVDTDDFHHGYPLISLAAKRLPK
ncbi:MAG TPA: glycosyl hydrolase family 18 protein [Polyangiaceae bacterium]|nr:glycosyl hydrolase family 18 protein [Polyangiaceae bacterium]